MMTSGDAGTVLLATSPFALAEARAATNRAVAPATSNANYDWVGSLRSIEPA